MALPGQLSKFTQEIADEICERIAEGESLAQICGKNREPHLPHRQTVFAWLGERPEFMRAYRRAREIQGDLLFDEIVPIADGRDEGAVEPREVSRDRLRMDARRYSAAKLAPRSYGERAALDPVDEGRTPERVEQANARAARIAALLEAARRRRDGEEE